MIDKDRVRAIYGELIGYLEQAPKGRGLIHTASLWETVNNAIQELGEATERDYSKFTINTHPSRGNWDSEHTTIDEYRNKLSGLIMRLHAEYFSDQPKPIGATGPNTVIHQSQHQGQNVQVTILLEVQSYIDQRLQDKNLKAKEKSFLQQLKEHLPTVKSTIELIRLIMTLAASMKLDIQAVIKALGM